jgi:hypothetical protein
MLTARRPYVPIVPICFRNPGDPKHGPRFLSLAALQRWVEVQIPAQVSIRPSPTINLARLLAKRRNIFVKSSGGNAVCRFFVEKQFVNRSFSWKVLDKRLLMYESSKRHEPRLETKVCSHCSTFDQAYTPALTRFCTFLKSIGRANYSLFIYDGEILRSQQLEDIVGLQDGNVIILHHQELAALIDSNFTMLGAS